MQGRAFVRHLEEVEVREEIECGSSRYLNKRQRLISDWIRAKREEYSPSAKIPAVVIDTNSSQLPMRASTPVFQASLNPSLPFGASKYNETNRFDAPSCRARGEERSHKRKRERV
jgi:hypothetical protein